MNNITIPSVEIIRQGNTLYEMFEHIQNCSLEQHLGVSPVDYVGMCIKNGDYFSK